MYMKGYLMTNPLADRTQRMLSVRDRDSLLDQWVHICGVIFNALAHPQSFLVANLSAESDRFSASTCVADGLDRSVKGVSIPVEFCEPLDSLFGLAPSGEGLSVLLSAGSLGLRVAVFTTAPPQEQHDFITGEVQYLASSGPDQFTLAGWVPEHLLDFPQSNLLSYMTGLRGLVAETRQVLGLSYKPTASAGDGLTAEATARIRADLGRPDPVA